MSEIIHIEVCKSQWKEGAYNVRIGNLNGSVSLSNSTKEEVLDLIKSEIKTIDNKEHDK